MFMCLFACVFGKAKIKFGAGRSFWHELFRCTKGTELQPVVVSGQRWVKVQTHGRSECRSLLDGGMSDSLDVFLSRQIESVCPL